MANNFLVMALQKKESGFQRRKKKLTNYTIWMSFKENKFYWPIKKGVFYMIF